MKYLLPFAILGLGGCAGLGLTPATQPAPPPETSVAPPPPPAARTVEQFDTTTEAQRAAASAASSSGRELGTVVATLGDPSQPGFWVETTLVSSPGTGRIELVTTGQSVEVELRPVAQGSARVSLAAWRLLDVALTDLAEITVFAG